MRPAQREQVLVFQRVRLLPPQVVNVQPLRRLTATLDAEVVRLDNGATMTIAR